MKSGYTLITTLGIMILISGLVVGLNSLSSNALRRSAATKVALDAELAMESTFEISKSMIVANIALPASSTERAQFDGSWIHCEMFASHEILLSIQDVAGLVDLRLASDEVVAGLVQSNSSFPVSKEMLSNIRATAISGDFVDAVDILIELGLNYDEAHEIAKFSTIYGRSAKVSRQVASGHLIGMAKNGVLGAGPVFGAFPTNSLFRVDIFSRSAEGAISGSRSLLRREVSGTSQLKRVYGKSLERQSPHIQRILNIFNDRGGQKANCKF